MRLKLLLLRRALLPADPILNMLLFNLRTETLNALLLRLNIVTPTLPPDPLRLQVRVVVAGLPMTWCIPRFVTLLVLPAVRCRVLSKHVGMATIVLEILRLRQLLVAPPTPRRTTVETLRGAQRWLLTLICGAPPLLCIIPHGMCLTLPDTWLQALFTKCPTEQTAPPGPAIVRCPVGLLTPCLLLLTNVMTEGAACPFLSPVIIIGLPFLNMVIYEPAALRLTLTTPFTTPLTPPSPPPQSLRHFPGPYHRSPKLRVTHNPPR